MGAPVIPVVAMTAVATADVTNRVIFVCLLLPVCATASFAARPSFVQD